MQCYQPLPGTVLYTISIQIYIHFAVWLGLVICKLFYQTFFHTTGKKFTSNQQVSHVSVNRLWKISNLLSSIVPITQTIQIRILMNNCKKRYNLFVIFFSSFDYLMHNAYENIPQETVVNHIFYLIRIMQVETTMHSDIISV